MTDARQAVRDALDSVRTIDPHCHLRPHKPAADTLADIVLYHHVWTELVSSGMDRFEVTRAGLPQELVAPGMPPAQRLERALPFLPNIRNTTLGLFLRWLLTDLYGIDELTPANLDSALALAEAKGRDTAWQEHVLRERCGIDTSITVEDGGRPYSDRMRLAAESFPGNLVNGKQSSREVLEAMDQDLGREVRTSADFAGFVRARVDARIAPECTFCGCWVLPYISHEHEGEDIDDVLRRAREGEALGSEDLGHVCFAGFAQLLQELRRTHVRTVQLIVGAEVLLPHRSIPHWSPTFTGAIGRIAGRFEDFELNLSSASDLYTQDLAILAKHVPNISVAGYWWHTFYPFYIRKSIETRLDVVPLPKIVGFFSDAYHSEWCYPKLKLVKQILEDVLVERIDRGWYTTRIAVDIVHALLHHNPKRIYRLD